MTAMKPCNDISWSSGALEIFKKGAFIYSLGSHIEFIPQIVRRKGRRVETFQIVGETFFPILGISRALKSVWKVLWFLHIAHCTRCAGQPSAQNEQTTDPCGIPEVRPRLQTSGPTSAKCFMCHVPPPHHFTCHTTVSSTKDYKRVNKNIRRLLAVTGPCSWMRHNFSQFPR